jgi:hypothetical protein
MAIGLGALEYLARKDILTRSTRLLDVGTQNLYNASSERIAAFLREFGKPSLTERELNQAAERIAYSSVVRAGERTAFLADLLDLTEISYCGYDVCPAPHTRIFDLNIDHVPAELRISFDLVLNFGTTEHVFNQLNAFEVIHDAVRVGGAVMHQLPSVGYIDHGYFNYNPLLLNDLVEANRYEIVDRFYSPSGAGAFRSDGLDIRDPDSMGEKNSALAPETLQNFNVNYVLRKAVDAPFRFGLELRTSHGRLSLRVAAGYASRRNILNLAKRRARTLLQRFLT